MLHKIFQEIWDTANGGLDQHTLRDKAFAEIPEEDYADALYEALLNDAYAFILSKRGEKTTHTARTRTATGTRNSARSTKQRKNRENWPFLRSTYSVAHGERKVLQYMTPDDCRAAAGVNRALAKGNMLRADWLDEIAAEQDKAGVNAVGKLPAEVLTRLQNRIP